MRQSTLRMLCCPGCEGAVEFQGEFRDGEIQNGVLICAADQTTYPVVDGVPQFVTPALLEGLNRRYSTLYDLISRFYDSSFFIASQVRTAFWPAGEDKARREIIDRLELGSGSKVLETGIGTGSNLPYIAERDPGAEFYGLDISPGMIRQTKRNLERWGLSAELFLAEGESLPFQDDAFDVVFHVGGINAFTDIKMAVDEMIRVARPGSRIVIADETEEVTDDFVSRVGLRLFFGRQLAGEIFKFRAKDMVEIVPPKMEEVRFQSIWENNGYLLEFRKSKGSH